MSKKGIKISPKHGLNPSLVKCFWCGNDKGLVLMGKIGVGKEDPEAPRDVVIDLIPCDDCKKRFSEGIHIVEATEDGTCFSNNRNFRMTSFGGKVFYPTGRWCVLKEGAINNMPKGSRVLTDAQTMDKLLEMSGEEKKTKEESDAHEVKKEEEK